MDHKESIYGLHRLDGAAAAGRQLQPAAECHPHAQVHSGQVGVCVSVLCSISASYHSVFTLCHCRLWDTSRHVAKQLDKIGKYS